MLGTPQADNSSHYRILIQVSLIVDGQYNFEV